MSLHACVLANVSVGSTLEAAEYIGKHDAVGLVVPTAGPHDLLVLVEAIDAVELGKIVVTFLQNTPGVTSTVTLLILEEIIPRNWLSHLLATNRP